MHSILICTEKYFQMWNSSFPTEMPEKWLGQDAQYLVRYVPFKKGISEWICSCFFHMYSMFWSCYYLCISSSKFFIYYPGNKYVEWTSFSFFTCDITWITSFDWMSDKVWFNAGSMMSYVWHTFDWNITQIKAHFLEAINCLWNSTTELTNNTCFNPK